MVFAKITTAEANDDVDIISRHRRIEDHADSSPIVLLLGSRLGTRSQLVYGFQLPIV